MDNANEQYQFSRRTASGIVKSGQGQMGGLFVASGTPTLKIYDGVDNTGTVIANTFQTIAATPYPLPVKVQAGIYVEQTGAGDVTYFWN